MAVPILRPFQSALKNDVYQAWGNGARNVLMRLDTGGGKTVTFADILREHQGWSCVIAHRNELVGQISLALARYGIRHNIIASDKARRAIARAHVLELGYSMFDPNARCVVASVDTIVRADVASWAALVTLWVVDEGHHLVVDNKWHRVIERFTHPACRGLLPTATPVRADGKGLGRHADGVADVMVQGPPMRWLIDEGYLTDYRIFCPPSDMKIMADVSASGDWSPSVLKEASQSSRIVGDVVLSYLAHGAGKLGLTFTTDVETAGDMTMAYRRAGVRAETLTGDTDFDLRRAIIRRFEAREVNQIVAVDIISEGFDLPAIEIVSMARPTNSLALYMQQFGRALRPLAGKTKAIIIDHVSNIVRHQGPPDKPRPWTLDARSKGRSSGALDAIPIRVCVNCYEPFEAIYRACPACGHYEPPAARAGPAQVAGDIEELDPAVLEAMRSAVADVDMTREERFAALSVARVPHVGVGPALRRHEERQEAQAELRHAMALWGGARTAEGLADHEIQRLFYARFGIDVLTAQTLAPADAQKLQARLFLTPS